MHNLFKRRKRMLGVYANKKGITLCETGIHRGDISIEKIACKEGRFGIEEIAPKVNSLMRDHDIDPGRVNIGIPSDHLAKGYLEFPHMPPRRTFQYIEYEMQRLYNIDPKLYRLFSYTLSIRQSTNHYTQRVVTFAVPKKLLELLVVQFRDIGLKINSFVLPLDAQLIILDNLNINIVDTGDVICLIHVEQDDMDICFYIDGDIISMASIYMDGRNIDYIEDELRIVFNYFHTENYGTDIGLVILSGECYRQDQYFYLFTDMGYRTIWFNDEVLGVKCKLDNKTLPPAPYINAIGSAMFY